MPKAEAPAELFEVGADIDPHGGGLGKNLSA